MADRMIVVVLDNQTAAGQARDALQELDGDGSITLYASAIVRKLDDGTVTADDKQYAPPLGTLTATPMGSLIGLIGGPAGLAAGAMVGLLVGALIDDDNARVGEDFAADVASALTPTKVAVVAQVDESWTLSVDTRMESLGGTVFRRTLCDVRHEVNTAAIAAMKSDLAAFKNEIGRVHAERKAKLQGTIERLEARIEAREETLQELVEARTREARAKRELLEKNAAVARRALKTLADTPV
jgi:uncharacterized membrane protein